jgi:hypothetical protein
MNIIYGYLKASAAKTGILEFAPECQLFVVQQLFYWFILQQM